MDNISNSDKYVPATLFVALIQVCTISLTPSKKIFREAFTPILQTRKPRSAVWKAYFCKYQSWELILLLFSSASKAHAYKQVKEAICWVDAWKSQEKNGKAVHLLYYLASLWVILFYSLESLRSLLSWHLLIRLDERKVWLGVWLTCGELWLWLVLCMYVKRVCNSQNCALDKGNSHI